MNREKVCEHGQHGIIGPLFEERTYLITGLNLNVPTFKSISNSVDLRMNLQI